MLDKVYEHIKETCALKANLETFKGTFETDTLVNIDNRLTNLDKNFAAINKALEDTIIKEVKKQTRHLALGGGNLFEEAEPNPNVKVKVKSKKSKEQEMDEKIEQ